MWSQYLWCLGLVALRHVGSSLDQGLNPCPLELAGGFFFFFFLADGFLTTVPPGKSSEKYFSKIF